MIPPRPAVLAAALLLGACAAGASAPAPAARVGAPAAQLRAAARTRSDTDRVQRLFRARCLSCHGGIRQQGGLSLLRRETAIAAAASGKAAVVPHAPDAGELLRRVTARAGRMPPAGEALTTAEVATLRRWIAAGAAWPRHWAFEPVRRGAVPAKSKVKRQKAKEGTDWAWVRNPIDAFVLQRLEREGLRPSPEADPTTLIRRLSLDLTGLPPTPEEVDRFVREWEAERKGGKGEREKVSGPDRERERERSGRRGSAASARGVGNPSLGGASSRTQGGEGPGSSQTRNSQPSTLNFAYERLVDRLLASPHFGERWGRHWLDLARYADSDGYEVDKPRPNAWYWRDWVIDAVNADMPFDQFTVQQLAGDLITQRSNGVVEYRSNGSGDRNPAPPILHHSVTSLGPLIATGFHRNTLTNNEGGVDREEYRVKAVFDRVSTTGSVWLGLTLGCAQCHHHPYDPVSQQEYFGLYAIFNNAVETEVEVPVGPGQPGKSAKVAVLKEVPTPNLTFLFDRGDFLRPRKDVPVAPGVPALLHPFRQRDPRGRADRLDLARWLLDPANSLTPRVAVNQVWLHLFRHGLVRTADDFGTAGEPPTHPELLDYLASEFVNGDGLAEGYGSVGVGKYGRSRTGLASSHSHTSPLPHSPTARPWSLKSLIRLIVTSATYRQSARVMPEGLRRDPVNRLLGRQNRWRVEAETVRDLHLAASGLLSRKIGGPSVFPPIPKELEKLTFRSQLPWKTSAGEDRYRRGMYTFFKRSIPDPNLVVFDCPDASATLARRNTSNTPLQALATLNNEVYLDAARALGRRLAVAELSGDGARLDHAFRLCLARPPRPDERARLLALLDESREWYRGRAEEGRRFTGAGGEQATDTAEWAAWTSVASVLTNLDEFITRE